MEIDADKSPQTNQGMGNTGMFADSMVAWGRDHAGPMLQSVIVLPQM